MRKIKETEFKYGGAFRTFDITLNDFTVIYITKVIYNAPATIAIWSDGKKTIAKCRNDDMYDPEKGVMICMLKRLLGVRNTAKLIRDWGDNTTKVRTLADVRREHNDE
jgi:hypothetical protein